MTVIITCRGISEPMRNNMLDGLVRALPDDWGRWEVPYSAKYGPANEDHDLLGESFDAAMAGLYELLDRAIRNADDKVVLAGYSAGAAGLGNLLARMPRYDNVICVILVADPFQPGGSVHGIAGSRQVPFYPVRWVSNPRDVICCCPADSPLRDFADITAAMSFGDVPGWGADLLDRLARDRWQHGAWLPNPIMEWRRWDRAIKDAAGYLGAGQVCQHTVYIWAGVGTSVAGRPTWLDEAASWVVRQL